MQGIDLHHFQMITPDPADAATGYRVDNTPYLVHATHRAPPGDVDKLAETVTADGTCMIRDGFTIHDVDHQFIPVGPPHPNEWREQSKIQKDSASTPFLKMTSVTSSGDPLSVCSYGAVGANLNCHDEGMKLSGMVVCPCSVVTKEQFAAIIRRLFEDYFKRIMVDVFKKVVETILGKLKLRAPTRAIVKWLAEKVIPTLAEWTERGAKALWDAASKGFGWVSDW